MYLCLLFLPFVGFIINILLSRWISNSTAVLLNIASLLLAILIALSLVKEVLILGSSVVIELGN
jgi:hypothetical protein